MSVDERRPVDLRLVPLALAVEVGAVLGTGGGGWALAACATVAVLTGALLLGAWRRPGRRWWLVATAVCLVTSAAVGGVRAAWLAASPMAEAGRAGAWSEVVARVVGEPRHSQGGFASRQAVRVEVVELTARGEHVALRAPALVLAEGDPRLVVGQRIACAGRARPVEAGEPITAVLSCARPRVVSAPAGVDAAVEWLRAGLRESLRHASPGQRALVPALVVGDVSAMTDDLDEQFRVTGLTHLNAVSGANLTLMLVVTVPLARALGVRGWGLAAMGLATVGGFVLLCRGEPSVIRAAAMGVVALAALGRGRAGGVRALAAAVVVLVLLDPWLARSAGFGLSVLATGGIVWWGSSWARVLSASLPGPRSIARPIGEAIAVPLAAQVATQPLVTALSGQLSVVGLVANLLAAPFVGPATVAGFVTVGVAAVAHLLVGWPVLGSLDLLPATLAALAASGILTVASVGSALPGAAVEVPTSGPWLIAVCGASALTALILPRVLAQRWLCVLLGVGLLLAPLRTPPTPGWPPPGWRVVDCDVGQGDGFVVSVAPGAALVVDTGPDASLMRRCLDQLGITRVPLLVLSHPHADHVDGLPGVLNGRRVGLTLLSARVDQRTLVGRLAAASVPVRWASVGERLRVGDVTWTTLGPGPGEVAASDLGAGGENSAVNDASVVGRVDVERRADDPPGVGFSVLFTGDAEPAAQADVLDVGGPLAVDVLKVPHHGSRRQDEEFLAATGARLALVGAGRQNRHGHPHPDTVRRLRALGMRVAATKDDGAIAVVPRSGTSGLSLASAGASTSTRPR